MPLPPFLHRYFWNAKVEEMDTEKHKRDIIETILEMGNIEACRWLLRTYPENAIIPVLRRSRCISPKSKSFWGVYFHIDFPVDDAQKRSAWYNRHRP
jgi:hypothetical protein